MIIMLINKLTASDEWWMKMVTMIMLKDYVDDSLWLMMIEDDGRWSKIIEDGEMLMMIGDDADHWWQRLWLLMIIILFFQTNQG